MWSLYLAYHVKANVSQYVILHDTTITRSGSHIAPESPDRVRALEARSIGTRMIRLAGNAMARKTGTRRNPGVLLKGRKCRNRSITPSEMATSIKDAKTSDPADDLTDAGDKAITGEVRQPIEGELSWA